MKDTKFLSKEGENTHTVIILIYSKDKFTICDIRKKKNRLFTPQLLPQCVILFYQLREQTSVAGWHEQKLCSQWEQDITQEVLGLQVISRRKQHQAIYYKQEGVLHIQK